MHHVEGEGQFAQADEDPAAQRRSVAAVVGRRGGGDERGEPQGRGAGDAVEVGHQRVDGVTADGDRRGGQQAEPRPGTGLHQAGGDHAEDELEGAHGREEVDEPDLLEGQGAVGDERQRDAADAVLRDRRYQHGQGAEDAGERPQPPHGHPVQQAQQQREAQVEEQFDGERPADGVHRVGDLDLGDPRLHEEQVGEGALGGERVGGDQHEHGRQQERHQVVGVDLHQPAPPEGGLGVLGPGRPGQHEPAEDEEEADAVEAGVGEDVAQDVAARPGDVGGLPGGVEGEDEQRGDEPHPGERRQSRHLGVSWGAWHGR